MFAFLTLHPFVFYPASLFALRSLGFRLPQVRDGDPDTLSYSICIPAYNEEAGIVGKVENTLKAASGVRRCQILVYVDGPGDRTAELLEPYRDRIDVVVGAVRAGKSHGLNVLCERATGDILVFTDANVRLDEEAIRRLGARFAADPNIGCVTGNLIYDNASANEIAGTNTLYWRLEEAIKQIESDVVGVVGADGSLFAVRRSVRVPVPEDLIDDFYLSMRVLLAGHRIIRAEDAIAYEHSATYADDEFRRKIRIACQAFNIHRVIWRDVAKRPFLFYCYVSHRLLKWLVIFDLTAAVLSFLVAAALIVHPGSVAVVTALAVAALWVAWRLHFGPARRLVAILGAFVGVGWGVLLSLRGERFKTWQPTPSAR